MLAMLLQNLCPGPGICLSYLSLLSELSELLWRSDTETFVIGVLKTSALVSSGSWAIWCYCNNVSKGSEAQKTNESNSHTDVFVMKVCALKS